MSDVIVPGAPTPKPDAKIQKLGYAPEQGQELVVPGGKKLGRDKRFYVGEKGKNSITDWNQIQHGASHETKADALDFAIAKEIGTYLCGRLPNREWGVNVDVRNCMIVIGQPHLSRYMGYHLHFKQGETMPQLLARCYMAACEILERFNVSRAKKTDPAEIEIGIKRDLRDEAVSPDAKPEPVNTKVHQNGGRVGRTNT